MVDTGAAPNLIKERNILPNTQVNEKAVAYLSGITEGQIATLGIVETSFKEQKIKFHIIPNNFPIVQEGILGADFLNDHALIDYSKKEVRWMGISIPFSQEDSIVVSARSQATFFVKIANSEIKTGYIPRLHVHNDVYLGEAIVRNRNGRAYLKIINASNVDREIVVPTVQLQEIEEIAGGRAYEKPLQSSNNQMQISIINQKDKRERISKVIDFLRLNHLNGEESNHVRGLIEKHADLFQLPNDKLGYTQTSSHRIITTDEKPVHTKQYRFPPIHRDEITRQVNELIENDIIEPSVSPYNSPLWIVPKKPDSQGNKRWRMVIDYRALNEKTIGDAYPLPNITEILDQLGSAKYFSIFDLASGFHQIPMHEMDAHKTAFSTPFGHYQFTRMPFGLKNAPATFQRLMDQVLTGLQGTELFVYLDDIVIYASSLKEHESKFNKLANRLRQANLRLQPDKCEFLRKEVSYLGHIIGEKGVQPDPQKVEAVQKFPRPVNEKNIKQFLGLAGYYRRFIPDFSKEARALTKLLKKDTKFTWGEEQEKSFEALKNTLCTEPLLQYPDFTRPFVITTDASNYAIAGILSQGTVGKDLPIAYASRTLNSAEQNYSTIEKELLAIVYSVSYFRPYVYGRKFTLVTDHKPLTWLNSVKDPTSRLARWRLKLAEYEYDVIYKAGKTNVNADALSRNPVFSTLPLEQEPKTTQITSDDDSDDVLYEPPQKPINQNKDGNQINNEDSETEVEYDYDKDESTETEDGSDDSMSEELFDNVNEHMNPRKKLLAETNNHLAQQKGYLAIFTTEDGKPMDTGARDLAIHEIFPNVSNAEVGRAKLTKGGKRNVIALIIEEKVSEVTELENLRNSIASLLDITRELNLETVSISKGSVGNVEWNTINNILRDTFWNENVKIIICNHKIKTPPIECRKELIIENHASAVGGHKGITKTYNRLKQKYFWPNMKSDIQREINNCHACQIKKLVRIKPRQPMILTDTPDHAFDKISMDIMGPLPITTSGHSYILTIQDLLTKHSSAIPLKTPAAIDVADAFTDDFICIHGAPKALLTDQGSHFLNSLMKNLARKFRIKHYKTTAYHPQSNGSVERSHHVLWEYLKQFVDKNNEWDKCLKMACFSYNTSMHEGTLYTPHELVYGRIARTPTANIDIEEERNESYAQYLENLYNKISYAQSIARDNLIRAKKRSKQYYDRRVREQDVGIGDSVYLLKEPVLNKLSNQYTGPYEIISILNNNNVKLLIKPGRTRIVHKDKIKKAGSRSPHFAGSPPRNPLQKATYETAGTSSAATSQPHNG